MAVSASETSQGAKLLKSRKRRVPMDEGDNDPSKPELVSQPSPKRSKSDSDESIKQMDPNLFADHISKKIRRSYRDLSSVELEEKYPSKAIFYDTSDFTLARDLENLPSFLQHFSGGIENLSSGSKEPGSPHTMFIAASGLRAADVTRSLRKFQSHDCAVAKLFAKHIKLADAIDHLERTKIGIGVGTPQRLLDLLDRHALKIDRLKRLVIDASYLDQKKRSIFDMKELLDSLLKLLSHPRMKDRLKAEQNSMRVLAF